MNQARLNFIELHKQEVIDSTFDSGIYPSVKMAQMIIESADSNGVAGNGITARLANNYFGIKANSAWTGKKMAFNTPNDGQPVNYFRVYDTVKDSISDHTKFLKENQRYNDIFKSPDPFTQLIAIQNAGYSESSSYAATLAKMIKDYNLTALDVEAKKKS